MIGPSQRTLCENTQHSQQTDFYAPGGIRTRNPGERKAAVPRLRPRGNRDQYLKNFSVVLQTCKFQPIAKDELGLYLRTGCCEQISGPTGNELLEFFFILIIPCMFLQLIPNMFRHQIAILKEIFRTKRKELTCWTYISLF